MKGVNDTLQDGQPVMLNLGVGSLSLRGGTATYSWNQSVLRGTAGGGQSSRNVSNEEPVQPAKLTTEALSQLQADIQHSGSRSTVSRVSKAASGVSKAGSRVSQASRVTAAGAKDSSQPQNALALEPDSRYSEPPAAMNVAAMQQCVMDARQAAKANARVKTATFILPVGPDDDAEPRMRQGKGKPEPASNTLVGANQVGGNSLAGKTGLGAHVQPGICNLSLLTVKQLDCLNSSCLRQCWHDSLILHDALLCFCSGAVDG